jgi:predicted nucleic acid-binding protein
VNLLVNEQIVTPDIAVYEVVNAIWKQEKLLKKVDNGKQYIAIFHGLIDSGKITVLPPNESLMQSSFLLAKQNNIRIYDAVFIALALQLNLSLKTLDMAQSRAFDSERVIT